MQRDKKRVMELHDQVLSLVASGDYENAISFAEKAMKLSDGMGVLHWCSEYYYHIIRINYDHSVHFKREYRKLIDLWEEVMRDEELEAELIDDTGVEGVFLYLLYSITMLRYKDCEKVPEYGRIAKRYQYIVEAFNISEFEGIDHFIASNTYLAHYFYSQGNALAAIGYYERILDRLDENDRINGMTFFSLVSLCFSYIEIGESEKAGKLAKFLYDGFHGDKIIDPEQKDLQRLVLVYANSYITRGLLGVGKKIIAQSIENGMIHHVDKDDYMWNICLSLMETTRILHEDMEPEFLKEMKDLIEEKELSGELESMPISDRAIFYYGKALFMEQMGEKVKALEYMNDAVGEYLQRSVFEYERSFFFSLLSGALEFYADHDIEKALECAGYTMKQLPRLYSGAEYLLDNVQMESYLVVCEKMFLLSYSCFSSQKNSREELFVYSVNFKNALLSVVRNRTKRIYHDKYNRDLVEKINVVRDKLASGKNGKFHISMADESEMEEKLEGYEKKFASLHEKNREMPFYSFEQIMTVLPRDTALIEMIHTDREAWKHGRTESLSVSNNEKKAQIDIFLLVKDSTVTFRHICITETEALQTYIQIFLEKIMSPKAKYQKEANKICELMFGEFRELLLGVSHIILSPHGELYNVPFELVIESAWEEMGGKEYIYCQSVRDLFENDYGVSNDYKDACVLGSPTYDLTHPMGECSEEGKRGDDIQIGAGNMGRVFDVEQIASLPYSRYEVEMVASLLGCSPLIGNDAVKYCIKNGYSIIHVATHGMLKEIGERNAWYNSGLTFSGIVDWYVSGKETDGYGNGLLTAEEISRMDLGTTDLAVLSACNSGTSRFNLYEQQYGLHLAFGVAGVKYVISALWQVDDLATSLLMRFFYAFLMDTGDVPEALMRAKEKLKNASAGEIYQLIRKDKGFISKKIYDRLRAYFSKVPETAVLYRAPRYYAAFICYQYKF